jgi:adenosylcobinamide-GDP ribazoletransferase
MRDSRVGTYGSLGLLLFTMLKLSSIALLASTPTPTSTPLPLLTLLGRLCVGHVLGRWSCTYLLWRYAYVEGVSAPGKEFTLSVSAPRLFFATLTALPISFLLLRGDWTLFTAVWMGSCYIAATMGVYVNRVLGGVIGDCLGATNHGIEIACYVILCVDWLQRFEDVWFGYGEFKAFINHLI